MKFLPQIEANQAGLDRRNPPRYGKKKRKGRLPPPCRRAREQLIGESDQAKTKGNRSAEDTAAQHKQETPPSLRRRCCGHHPRSRRVAGATVTTTKRRGKPAENAHSRWEGNGDRVFGVAVVGTGGGGGGGATTQCYYRRMRVRWIEVGQNGRRRPPAATEAGSQGRRNWPAAS